jgi:23S rRNA G2445 N2-methylase RlmL
MKPMSQWMREGKILVTCAKGLSSYLQAEILSLGFPVRSATEAAVETAGTLADTMTLNLNLRSGHRVLYRLHAMEAGTPEELYDGLARLRWEDFIDPDGYLCVTSFADTPTIRDSRFLNLKGKDAIVDRLQRICGRRPDSGPDRGGTVVHLYWKGRRVLVYLDTSGEPLSKRGYRKIPLEAPMQETLAAAVVLASEWKERGNFINPMCGSGTLAIEAAMIAADRAPGLVRHQYGFMHIRGFQPSAWRNLRTDKRKTAKKRLSGRIIATDHSRAAVDASVQNARTAGVDHLIEFSVCDYQDTLLPDGGGVVVVNPPYGERLGEVRALEATYRGVGDFFKRKCRGYTGCLFTGNPNLARQVGLKTKRRIPFYNGEIECRLLIYELYEGSRKASCAGLSGEKEGIGKEVP